MAGKALATSTAHLLLTPRAMHYRTMGCLAALALLTAACGVEHEVAAETEQVRVEDGRDSLAIEQRFDAAGELLSTRIVHRRGDSERVVEALGALVTGAGTTASGRLVRAFLAGVPPALLARVHRADVRFDVAVLTADALLGLEGDQRRAAVRALDGDGPLCARLNACESEPSPGQT